MSAKLPQELQGHPLFRPGSSFGIMSAEAPRFQGELNTTGHEGLLAQLKLMGLQGQAFRGEYDGPERYVAIYGPSREQMFALGRKFGQQAVIWGHNLQGHPGTHAELLHCNGAHAGKVNLPAETVPAVEHFLTPPENYYSEVPGGKGYFRLNFSADKMYPVPLSVGTQHPQALAPAQAPRPDLTKNLKDAQDRRPRKAHPHAYAWHDGHTSHNIAHVPPGAMLVKNDGGRTDQSLMDNHFHLGGSFSKGDNIGGPNAAGDMSVPPPRGTFSHMADTLGQHNDGQLGKGAITDPSMGLQPLKGSFTKDEPEPSGDAHLAADKQTPVEYHHFALPFGQVNPKEPQALQHYRYEGRLGDVQRQVKDHGYQVHTAGGRHGKPDLANRNYNTRHLMVYDAEGDHETNAWRQQHELAHALTLPEVNKLYGEGRRTGKLGEHRTLGEARRAVHWEWLAGHRQKELAAQLGIHISDQDFAREMNTLMHDAAHRAVTGKFRDAGAEGFKPHSHLVPLETALELVNDHGRKLGITDPHKKVSKAEEHTCDFCPKPATHSSIMGNPRCKEHAGEGSTLRHKHLSPVTGGGETTAPKQGHLRTIKSEPQSTTLATEQRSMADETKVYTPEQFRLMLAKALHERIETYASTLGELQKREAGDSDDVEDLEDLEKRERKGVPGVSKWHQHAPGTGAHNPNHHGYTHSTEHGEYHIGAPTKRGGGYSLTFAHTRGTGNLPHGGLWHDLGSNHRSPNAAATAAHAHHEKISQKAEESASASATAKKAEPLDKVAPPGREEQVRALKPKVGVASAFKIAWASYNHGKEAKKNMTGGSENISSGTPGLMMSEHPDDTVKGQKVHADDPDHHPCGNCSGSGVAWVANHVPPGHYGSPRVQERCRHCLGSGRGLGKKPVAKGDMPAGNMAMPNPPSSMNLAEADGGHKPDVGLLAQKQAVPVKTDDPRSNSFVTAGNNQKPDAAKKAEHGPEVGEGQGEKKKDASGKADGRQNTLRPQAGTQPGLLSGDRTPPMVPHGTGSGAIEPATLDTRDKSPSNKVPDPFGPRPSTVRKADVPMAKPPSGNPSAGAVPQSKPMGAAPMGKGAQTGIVAAPAHQPTTVHEAVVPGTLGKLKGALAAARAPKAPPQALKASQMEKGLDIGSMKGAAVQAAGAAAGAPGHAAAAPAAKMPTQAEHADRASMYADFMPSASAGHQMAAPAPAAAAKPAGMAAPAAAAKPAAAPALGAAPKPATTSTLKPPSAPGGSSGSLPMSSQSAFGAKPKPLAPPSAGGMGGVLGHVPKLTGILSKPKPTAPAAGAPGLKQSEKK